MSSTVTSDTTDGEESLPIIGTAPSSDRNVDSFVRNSAMLTFMSLMVSGMGFIYRIYMAKTLGGMGYGSYLFVTTFVTYFGIIALFGFRNVIIQRVAARRDEVHLYAGVGLQMRLISATVALLVVLVATFVLKRTANLHAPLIVCALSLPATALNDALEAVFLGLERSQYSAISAVIANVVKVGLGLELLHLGYGLVAILALFTVASFLNALVNWMLLRKVLQVPVSFRWRGRRELRRSVFQDALPFWYAMLAVKVYYRNDVLILGWLKGDTVVGWYGGAYMAIDFLLLVGNAVTAAALPILSRIHAETPGAIAGRYNKLCKYLFLAAWPVCCLVSIFGPAAIPIVLGHSFVNGADALRVLIWTVLFEAQCLLCGTVLAATGNPRLLIMPASVTAVVCLVSTFVLVTFYGYMGAAWATTLNAVLSLAVAYRVLKRVLPRASIMGTLRMPVMVAAASSATILLLAQYTRIWAIVIGLIAYVSLVLVTGCISPEDIVRLKRIAVPRWARGLSRG